jgi:peptide/nickel transport system ATP-binding protein
MSPLLEVQGLSIRFRTARGGVQAVSNVSFSVQAGETLAIVGESGSGKSATALSLMRLLDDTSAEVRGRVLFDSRDIMTMSEAEVRALRGRQMAMVFQDPMSSLNPVRTIGAQMTELLQLHLKLNGAAAVNRATDYLKLVGIPDARRQLNVYPHEFSGGMRQRVMIAMGLSCEPRLLIADEPTTALDVSVQAQILDLLRRVSADSGTSLVMISHDLSVVAGLADRVAVMYGGELVEVGPTESLFRQPTHPYTVGLLQCIPRIDAPRVTRLRSIEGAPPAMAARSLECTFAPRCSLVHARCLVEHPVLEPKPNGLLAACWADPSAVSAIALEPTQPSLLETPILPPAERPSSDGVADDHLLEALDLRVHFRMRSSWIPRTPPRVVRAVDGVSLNVLRGEILSIVGESGSGKSTVARAVLGLIPLTEGSVTFEGRQLGRLSAADLQRLRPRMQMVFQDPYGSLNPRLSVGTTVAEPLIVNHVLPGREVWDRVADLLLTVGLDPALMDRYPHELSGGQRQRVSIARALAPEPTLIVADEPTSALDVSVRAQILNLMQDLQASRGLTYIFISHDLSVVRHMSNRVLVMYLGKVVEIAERDTLYADPRHPYTQALLSVVPVPDPLIERRRRRAAIAGEIPSPANPPPGCRFHTRCPLVFDRCRVEEPPLLRLSDGHAAACFLAEENRAPAIVRGLSESGA